MSRIKLFTSTLLLLLVFSQCKTQYQEKKVPFTIVEKSYFHWTDATKHSKGIEIKIVGNFTTTSLGFSTIYFQSRKFEVVPVINGNRFTLIGNESKVLNPKLQLTKSKEGEFGNQPVNGEKIPFELTNTEALIVYTINGENFFYKVKNVAQLENVTR